MTRFGPLDQFDDGDIEALERWTYDRCALYFAAMIERTEADGFMVPITVNAIRAVRYPMPERQNERVCGYHKGVGYTFDGNGFLVPVFCFESEPSAPGNRITFSLGAWTAPSSFGGFLMATGAYATPDWFEATFDSYPAYCGGIPE